LSGQKRKSGHLSTTNLRFSAPLFDGGQAFMRKANFRRAPASQEHKTAHKGLHAILSSVDGFSARTMTAPQTFDFDHSLY